MPEISDETEQTKTVVVRQRAYAIPSDVAAELARVQREGDTLLKSAQERADRHLGQIVVKNAELARLREENERLKRHLRGVCDNKKSCDDCPIYDECEALAGGEVGK